MSSRRLPDSLAALDRTMPEMIIMDNEKPVEMYKLGNYRIYLDDLFMNCPKFRVKALLGNGTIQTITNDTINGILSQINNNSKSQLEEGEQIFFDDTFIDSLKQRGINTSLFSLENDLQQDQDNSGVHTISEEIMARVAKEAPIEK